MSIVALVDTGPLVAILDSSDSKHTVCVEALSTLRVPLISTWPVLTETAYLLRNRIDLVQRLIRSTTEGFIRIEALDDSDALAMINILDQYSDQRFQLDDLSLMHLADRDGIGTIFSSIIVTLVFFEPRMGMDYQSLPSFLDLATAGAERIPVF